MDWQRFTSRLGVKRSQGTQRRKQHRRRLLMEHLARRELMAADLGAISGTAFTDQAGDGLTADDPPLSGVQVQVFEDTNGDSTLDGSDVLIGTDITDADGQYRFDDLSLGRYFVQQDAVPGQTAPEPQEVNIIDDDGTQITLIDDYNTTDQTVTATATTPTVASSSAAPEAIGGSRDLQATQTGGGSSLEVLVDATSGLLSVSAGAGTTGEGLIQYDGNDGSIALDATGLGGVSLTGTSTIPPNASLVIESYADLAGVTAEIRVYSDATNYSTATFSVPVDTNPVETLLSFSSFTAASGTGADFNNIGAIEALITSPTNADSFVNILETIVPAVVETSLANVLPVELAGQVFYDNGSNAGELNNGLRDGTEAGATGVTVDLYQVAGADGSVDPATDTPVASTTTGANGTYTFAGLDPGNYIVVVPETSFDTGSPLFGYATSTGNDPATDPDDNLDDVDDGTTVAGLGIASGVITLVANNEPADDDDTDANTNTTVDFGVIPQIDLQISKTLADGSDEFAGGTAVFDVVVQNNGPLTATDVQVQDIIPAGLTFDSIQNASGSFTTSVSGSTLTVDMGSLPNGGSGTFQILATIDSGQTANIVNTATVSGFEVETDATNNSDDETVALVQSDLRITKTDQTDPISAGNQQVYTLTVTNDGPDAAEGVVVVDTLPAGVTFVSGDLDGDSGVVSYDSTSGEVTVTVGTLANAAVSNITITVDVAPDATSPLTNVAVVTAEPDTDPDPSNNTASQETVVDRDVDVAIEKTVTGTPVAGQTVAYTVQLTNSGPGDARGVSVIDTLDANLTFDSLDAGTTGVTVSQSGQQLTFDVGTLATGATTTFSFDVMIDAAATGTIANTADVTTTDNDSDATNDGDSIDMTVQQQVDLIIDKSVDLATAVPGQDELVYTIVVSHDADSSSDATNVVITDVLPEGLVGVSITAPTSTDSSFDAATNTVAVEFDSIPAGETRTFTINVDVDPDATGNIINPASVASDGTDLDAANNTDDASTSLTPSFDVAITKTVDDSTPAPAETVVYTIGLNNTGPSTATGVVLTDAIPAGLTFVSGTLAGQAATSDGTTISFPAITLDDEETATATLTFTVNASASGTITNTGTVVADAGESDTDNNDAAVDITITPVTDLQVSQSVNAADAVPGDELTYTVTVTNDGPSPASNVVVTDNLPDGVTFVSGTGPDGEALTVNSSGVVTVDGGTLAADEDFSFTIIASVDAATATADLQNSVTVASDTQDSDTSNNTATATTAVDPVLSSLAGSVYVDANNDGARGSSEQGIEGVTLTLTGTDFQGNAVNRTVTTDADGDYVFDQLAQGNYTISETQPDDYRDGKESAPQSVNATIADNVISDLDLDADQQLDDLLFGELADILSKRRFLASTPQ